MCRESLASKQKPGAAPKKNPELYMNPAIDTSQPAADGNSGDTGGNAFGRVRFVLVETSHPGNVGSVARAIKTMGFGSLVLVSPREPDVLRHSDAVAMASGADDVLAGALDRKSVV